MGVALVSHTIAYCCILLLHIIVYYNILLLHTIAYYCITMSSYAMQYCHAKGYIPGPSCWLVCNDYNRGGSIKVSLVIKVYIWFTNGL